MATNVGNVHLDTSVLDRITAELRPKASNIVKKYGIAIAGEAAKNAPVDTSALRNSILLESHMDGDLSFIVQDGTGEPGSGQGAGYGLFQELGHMAISGKFVAARPFMIPAVEAWRERFYAAFAGLFK